MGKPQYKKEDIIDQLVNMRIKLGQSTKSCIDFLKKDLGYKHAYAYELYREARVKIKEIYNARNEAALEESIGQLERMLEYHMQTKNFKQALEVRKELNKIAGHYTEKIEMSGNLSHIVEVIKLNRPQKED